jgi:hypothetical protein
MRRNISSRLRQITDYGDDILVAARTKQTSIDTFMKLRDEARGYRLL